MLKHSFSRLARRLLPLLLLPVFGLAPLAAQTGSGGSVGVQRSAAPGPGARGPYSARPAIGTITGQVLDSLSGQALEYATIALYALPQDSLVGGTLADAKGRFSLSGVRIGAHRVEISFLGYNVRSVGPVLVRPDRALVELQPVLLSEAEAMLDAVEVTAEREYMQLGIDRKVYRIDKDLTAQSGDALDAMRNIPSLDVGVEGQVSLRGSANVTILIDGKPSGLLGGSREAILEQLPASAIEAIEVITNPSARFNPDGTAGIINIVTRRDRREGLSGGLNLGVGTRDKYNAAGNLSYRTGRFNFYGSYGYRYNEAFSIRSTYRETFTDGPPAVLDQRFDGDGLSQAHNGKLGMDWYVDPKTTVSLSGLFGSDRRERSGSTFYRFPGTSGVLEGLSVQGENDDESGWNTDLDFRIDKLFAQPSRQWTLDARYARSGDSELENNVLTDYLDQGQVLNRQPFIRDNLTEGNNRILTVQTDYIHPHMVSLGDREVESWRIETGAQVIARQVETDQLSEILDTLSGMMVVDEGVSNRFRLTENILSVYGSFRKRWTHWGLQAGLRVEQALTDPQLLSTGEVFNNDYFSLFPSFYLSRSLDKNQELQWNYSRRINRPNRWALNPFIDNTDPQNIRVGNPDLQPEYVHAVEFNYARNWASGHALTASVFFRQTDDVIRNIRLVDSLGISTQTWDNFDWQRDYGMEIISSLMPWSWLRLNASASLFRANFQAGTRGLGLTNNNLSWNVKTNASLTLPGDFQAQVAFRYQGPGLTAQGQTVAIPELDIALRRDFWSGKGSLTLRVSDILDKQRYGFVLEDPDFFQDSFYKRESRIGWITFSYKFGKQSFERRRNSGGGGGPGGGDFSPDMGM